MENLYSFLVGILQKNLMESEMTQFGWGCSREKKVIHFGDKSVHAGKKNVCNYANFAAT